MDGLALVIALAGLVVVALLPLFLILAVIDADEKRRRENRYSQWIE